MDHADHSPLSPPGPSPDGDYGNVPRGGAREPGGAMPAPLTTKPQVNGYRFIVRRMEHAVVRRDVRMLHEPLRSASRSLVVGGVLGTLVMAGFGIAAWVSPDPDTDGASILLAENSGALYVRVPEAAQGGGADGSAGTEDVLHPVLNLASARLIAGDAAAPQAVPDGSIPGLRRGALAGIPGAPQRLPGRESQIAGPWTVCDELDRGTVSRTVVLVGEAEPVSERPGSEAPGSVEQGQEPASSSGPARPLGEGHAVLVASGGRDYLVYGGARSVVVPSDPAVSRSLGLAGVEPAGVSHALIAALPEGPPLQAPRIAGAGTVPVYPIGGARVGDVVRTGRGGATDLYLVLPDGLQPVTPMVADLITYSGAGRGIRMRDLPAAVVAGAPVTRSPVDVDGYPAYRPDVRADPPPVLCASMERPAEEESAVWHVLAGGRLPTDRLSSEVHLVGADGPGPSADGFVMEPGSAAHVRASGHRPADGHEGPRFLVGDTGTRYGIPDSDTSTVLGLGAQTDPAPWSILGLLPAGPALTRSDALVVHDGLAPDPAPESLAAGE